MRDLFLLKQIKPIAMWKGDIVHQALAEYFRNLQNGQILPYSKIAGFAKQLAELQWEFSRAARYRRQGRTRAGRAFAALLEHEYKLQDVESLDEALDHIRTCVTHFYDIDARHGISAAFREGHKHLVEPPAWGDGATTFDIQGIRVTVKVDLAFANKDGRYEIIDWKTGKAHEDASAQLELYILWAHLSLAYPLESISAHEISLYNSAVSSYQLTDPGRSYRLAAIHRSANLIKVLTSSTDMRTLDISEFSYARHVATCRRCPLLRVCQEFS
jgi:hypothetical protein